ncbi:hypothetical protein L1887_42373 [Cichorium endivia]|nr:hypothetical protein L1887_42373 [Cichorium endivia]
MSNAEPAPHRKQLVIGQMCRRKAGSREEGALSDQVVFESAEEAWQGLASDRAETRSLVDPGSLGVHSRTLPSGAEICACACACAERKETRGTEEQIGLGSAHAIRLEVSATCILARSPVCPVAPAPRLAYRSQEKHEQKPHRANDGRPAAPPSLHHLEPGFTGAPLSRQGSCEAGLGARRYVFHCAESSLASV